MGVVVVVANQKGGVGKTTTAVNMAAAAGLAERRVLLIDLDPQSNATSGAGVAPAVGHPTVYEALLGLASLEQTLLANPAMPFVKIAPASPDLAAIEVELVNRPDRNTVLREVLKPIRDSFDIIFVDCPPSLGILTISALTAADMAILPIQCEYYALEGVSQLLTTINLVRERTNPQLEIAGVLLTMYDHRLTLSRQVADDARSFFRDLVFPAPIPRNVRVAEAPSFGKPVVLYDTGSSGAMAYLQATEIFLKRLNQFNVSGAAQKT